MNPEYPNQSSNQAQPQAPHSEIKNPIGSMLPGEQELCQITRHPIGLLGIYIMAGFVLVVLAILAFVVAPKVLTSDSKSQVTEIGALVFLVVGLGTAVFVFISNKVYWGNRWILTTDSLTQVTQTSLFDKQSSQLSLGNLEDVTAEQNGVLCHMFNYGVLRVETAGERSKFMFLYCPNPNSYAQKVLGAREAFEQKVRQVGGVNEGNYPPSQPSAGYPPATTPPSQPQNPLYPPQQSPVQTGYPTNPDPGVNIDTE